jgi:RNA polymerase sigma-70 factor (ECF subfamily)
MRYAQRITGNAQTARDIVQDTFLRLCREEQSKIEPIAAQWLFRVCRNRAFDIMRKDQRMNQLAVSQDATLTSGGRDPGDAAVQHDESQRALELLATLPDNQREVIRLKIEHGLSYRQIAEVTGHSVSNVGYLLHVGLKSLREMMASP